MGNEVERVLCRRMSDQTHYARPLSTLHHGSFQLLFGRIPGIALDMLVPQMGDTEATGNLKTFIENRRHNMRGEAPSKIYEDNEAAR